MKFAILVGTDSEGKATILSGPAEPFHTQRKKFQGFKTGDMPKGVERVGFYILEKSTSGIDRKAQALRLKAESKSAPVVPSVPE